MNKASSNMYISQPALSIAIRNLEAELNTALFERIGKKLVITKTGEAIVPCVEKILQYEEEIKRLSKNADREVRTVRLLVLAGSAMFPGIITTYRILHPHIDFNVIHKNSADIEPPDLIIKAGDEFRRLKDNETLMLTEKILMAVPKNHKLAEKDVINVRDLPDYELIGLNGNLSLKNIEEIFCKREGITLKHSIECDNPSILRDLISRGIGPALVAEKTWLFQQQTSVKLIPLDNPMWKRDIIIEKTGFRNNHALVDDFSDFLLKEITKL